ncbi:MULTISPECIES: glycosyltransferase family 2 protein [Streptacidiphilus]|uniref:Glycosyltransferase family 2 protein n=2 Tax=Streptacidiphilus TaxID=228398 RepID=A0ABV6USF9_9ACTN|nr:glycosyltransferase family 2 protein [Streptacidiphilus jeojiense]
MSLPDDVPPDVSVIVPIHNTRPYLERWFDSLVRQSLGTERLQLIVVDDGSDDDCADAVERLAAAHPGLRTTVLRLPDRGGPGRARNRGMEHAVGRYLFFLDSDDWLGDEALARIVAVADARGSGIVVGRVVGVDGRWVPDFIWYRSDPDVRFPGSDLAWSLTPSKLFRHDLVREPRMWFREDLPVYSDGPFVLEAYYRAGRVSVLGDYDYYFQSLRPDRGNITSQAAPGDRLPSIEAALDLTARLSDAGPERDLVNARHLRCDVVGLFRSGFELLDRPEQQRILDIAARLLRTHRTEGALARCTPEERLKLHCVSHGLLDELVAVVRHEQETGRLPEAVEFSGLGWSPDGRALTIATRRPPALDRLTGPLTARLVPSGGDPELTVPAGAGPLLTVPLRGLVPGVPGPRRPAVPAATWSLRLETDHAGSQVCLPVPARPGDGAELPPPLRIWRGGRPYQVSTEAGPDGELLIGLAPVSLRKAARWRLRCLGKRLGILRPGQPGR